MGFVGYYDPMRFCKKPFEAPKDVYVPVCDETAWPMYPKHRHCYNKMWICQTQKLKHGPLGVMPESYPVFYKPIINLQGMGKNSMKVESEEDWDKIKTSGFWMEFIDGVHCSHDFIVKDGQVLFDFSMVGKPAKGGKFDYWVPMEKIKPLVDYCSRWIKTWLPKYSGGVNIETIRGNIIECHLRLGDVLRMGDEEFLKNLFSFFKTGIWQPCRVVGKAIVPVFVNEKTYQERLDNGVFQFSLREQRVFRMVDSFSLDIDKEECPGGVRVALLMDDLSRAIGCRDMLLQTIEG